MLQRPEPHRPFAFLKDLTLDGCRWPVRETADGRCLLCNAPVADMPQHGAARRSYCARHASLSRVCRKALSLDERKGLAKA